MRIKVDRVDVMAFGGLLVMGIGIGMLSVPWAMIIIGGLVFGIGIGAAMMRLR